MTTNARQNVCLAQERVLFSAFTSGVALPIFSKLPNGVIPISGYAVVITPLNSETSDLLTVGKAVSGTAASANGYLTSSSLQAAANTRYAFAGLPAVINDTDGGITMTATLTSVDGAEELTEGEVMFVLQYAVDGKEQFSQS